MIELSGPLLAKYNPESSIAKDLNSVVAKLAAKDDTLWGTETEAPTRLNWIDLPTSSRSLIEQLNQLVSWTKSAGLNNLILCGMGGSSLAPEVFAKTFGKQLTVLDSTDPDQIGAAIPTNLAKTLVIVGSKSGSTIETASQKALFEKAFRDANLDPREHFLIITDPNSPLDLSAKESGYKVVNADPNVGGRYSALSAFGLTPAALIGVDIEDILKSTKSSQNSFVDANSSVVQVATLILEQSDQNIAFFDSNSAIPGIKLDDFQSLLKKLDHKSQALVLK